MSPPTVDPRLSVRRLLLVVIFLLGSCVVLLSEIVNATSGFTTTIGELGVLVGGVVTLGSLVALYDSVSRAGDADGRDD
ncbi:MAG: hypothetical protein ABEJ74_06635 [Haloferacaceae archaeon]